ncbi:MAG: NifU family protein [Alphaproteobacteria bacterium]
MFIQTETTNDPAIVRFLPGRPVTGSRTIAFTDPDDTDVSPLAARLFTVDGVGGVTLGRDHVTVAKTDDAEWEALRPAVLRAIMEHFMAGDPVLSDDAAASDDGDDVVGQIRELIDTRIQPAVSQNGGAVIFQGFEDGIVLLDMEGPAVAMKLGIENMLKHYVPEVETVQSFEEYERLKSPAMNTPEALSIRRILDEDVNPAVASHGGHIALIDVKPDTVYIRLEGGCQDCGMADMTLKNGVEVAIKQAVPAITAVLDVTDHAGGDNPYYQPGKGGAGAF